jgi:hypothetical protein
VRGVGEGAVVATGAVEEGEVSGVLRREGRNMKEKEKERGRTSIEEVDKMCEWG